MLCKLYLTNLLGVSSIKSGIHLSTVAVVCLALAFVVGLSTPAQAEDTSAKSAEQINKENEEAMKRVNQQEVDTIASSDATSQKLSTDTVMQQRFRGKQQ